MQAVCLKAKESCSNQHAHTAPLGGAGNILQVMTAAQSVLRVCQLTSLPHNCGAQVMQVVRVFQVIKAFSSVRRKCFVLVSQRCLARKVNCRPTQRAPDVWESARFTGIFLASGLYCPQSESTPAHTRVTQTVGRNED